MKNFWKKYHKWVGLFFSFFILMFCFSGIVLNHRTLFSKAEVSRNWMPESYHYKNWNNGIIKGTLRLPDGKILASVFDSFKDSKGVIFDGFPRTIPQAEALKVMLKERGQDISVMLDLDVPEEELMTRLIKRGKESGRADDNEETIKKRLVVYNTQTSPLKEYYKGEGKYQHITLSDGKYPLFIQHFRIKCFQFV